METLPLKEIHLPPAPAWWPPAIGWWLLAVCLPLLIVTAVYVVKRLRRQTALKTARKLLLSLRRDRQDDLQTLVALSAWLRRVALSVAPRQAVAALSGEAWLLYLDQSFSDAPFSRGVGRCLADVQYRRRLPEGVDFDALFDLCERWLKQQPKAKR